MIPAAGWFVAAIGEAGVSESYERAAQVLKNRGVTRRIVDAIDNSSGALRTRELRAEAHRIQAWLDRPATQILICSGSPEAQVVLVEQLDLLARPDGPKAGENQGQIRRASTVILGAIVDFLLDEIDPQRSLHRASLKTALSLEATGKRIEEAIRRLETVAESGDWLPLWLEDVHLLESIVDTAAESAALAAADLLDRSDAPYTIVHGPPFSGKTTLAAMLVLEAAARGAKVAFKFSTRLDPARAGSDRVFQSLLRHLERPLRSFSPFDQQLGVALGSVKSELVLVIDGVDGIRNDVLSSSDFLALLPAAIPPNIRIFLFGRPPMTTSTLPHGHALRSALIVEHKPFEEAVAEKDRKSVV